MASVNDRGTKVCFIGSFPPAAGGQGLVNESFRRLAEDAGAEVRTIDISANSGGGTWRGRIGRIPKVLLSISSLGVLLVQGEADSVYLGVASGYGQLFDIAFTVLIRVSGVRLFLHYDSYDYLLNRRTRTAALVQLAGPSATHIVLCEDMKRRLLRLYGSSLRIVVISNSTNIEVPVQEPRARMELKTIGFISNLSRAKGVLEFLDVAERVCSARPDVQAILAGPIEEPSLRPIIEDRLRRASWITYLGPVYGDSRSRFYTSIDTFIFPTRYENEADPRVVNEALAHGVVVIASTRGCIGSVVAGGGGVIIHEAGDFIDEAHSLLVAWHDDPDAFSSISAAALDNSARLRAEHGLRLNALISGLVSVSAQPT